MQGLAHQAYGQIEKRTAGEKHIEYTVFQQITDALEEVAEQETKNPSLWADAINRNLQLWSALSVDLLHPDNALPNETKQSLLYIAEFVRQNGLEVLSGTGNIEDLIDVNKTIMQGLSGAK